MIDAAALLQEFEEDDNAEEEIELIPEENPIKKIAQILEKNKPDFDFEALNGDFVSKSLIYFFIPRNISAEEANSLISKNPENALLDLIYPKSCILTRTKGPKNFKVGDKIIMNKTANGAYDLSKEGSEGVITKEREDGEYDVKFTKVTGNYHQQLPITWNIEGEYMNKCLDQVIEEIGAGSYGLTRKLSPENKFLEFLIRYQIEGGKENYGEDEQRKEKNIPYADCDMISFIAVQSLASRFPLISSLAEQIGTFIDLKQAVRYCQLSSLAKDKSTKAKLSELAKDKEKGIEEKLKIGVKEVYSSFFSVISSINEKGSADEKDVRKMLRTLFEKERKIYEKAALFSGLVESAKIVKEIFPEEKACRELKKDLSSIEKNLAKMDFSGLFKQVITGYLGKELIFGRNIRASDYEIGREVRVKTGWTHEGEIGKVTGKCHCGKWFIKVKDDDIVELSHENLEAGVGAEEYLTKCSIQNYKEYKTFCEKFASENLRDEEIKKFEKTREDAENKLGIGKYLERKNTLELISKQFEKIYKNA